MTDLARQSAASDGAPDAAPRPRVEGDQGVIILDGRDPRVERALNGLKRLQEKDPRR